jgi:Family of unknown function (DUF6502)
MNDSRKPPKGAEAQADPDKAPDSRGDLLLAQSAEMLAPLARLLVANGVGYTQLAQAMKRVFMQAARLELQAEGRRVTDAAISLRSGVHRKEVRAAAAAAAEADDASTTPPRALSLAEQIFTKWLTDAGYRDVAGHPATLPLTGPAPSFDSLVTSVSKDFSRRTILDELLRLGLVREETQQVVPLAEGVVPRQEFGQVAKYYAAHLHDHLAAGAANVRAASTGARPPFLENSVYANGLSAASIEQLGRFARTLWKPAFNQMVEAANQRFALDRDQSATGRIRFGVYFYSDPAPASDTDDAPPASPNGNPK